MKPAFIFSSAEGGLGKTTTAGFILESMRRNGKKIAAYDFNFFATLTVSKSYFPRNTISSTKHHLSKAYRF